MNSALFVRLVTRPSVTSFSQDCLIAHFSDILHGVRFWVIFDENSYYAKNRLNGQFWAQT